MITWNYKKIIGQMTFKDMTTNKLYKVKLYGGGNCLYVGIYKDTIYNFATCINHLKNMLGLNKGFDNIFLKHNEILYKIQLKREYKYTLDIIKCFIKTSIKIEIV